MGSGSLLFRSMAGFPLPYLVAWPIVLIVLLAVGWTRDDYIEDKVANIWIATDGDYWNDKAYADQFGEDTLGSTSFAAMAIARDGENLLNEERLEEIRARMEKAETTTIEYKGNTYTWDDVCALNNVGLGTTYKFPCVRLSPMDYYQEADWFFQEDDRVSWHEEVVRKLLVAPRIPRFGILQGVCSSAGGPTSQSDVCDHVIALRTIPAYAAANGYPPSYVDPLSLFSDIGNLENNDPCKICIETGFEATLNTLTTAITGMFQVLLYETNRLFESTAPAQKAQLGPLLQQLVAINQSMDKNAVLDFYSYYVTRTLYAQLGQDSYVEGYSNFMAGFGDACDAVYAAAGEDPSIHCPRTVTPAEANAALLAHADNSFSSVTTAGVAFPFWSQGDGTGSLFAGKFPVGGSGLPMGGQLLSTTAYLDLANFAPGKEVGDGWNPLYSNGQFLDPLTPGENWARFVETDPVYRWFIAGVTPMTSHCGNGNLTGTETGIPQLDVPTRIGVETLVTSRWCTKYNTPYLQDGEATQQHFAKMWYDLLIDSPSFLGIVQGESDPYTWTTGQGCDYELKGTRFKYEGQDEMTILNESSRVLYYVDEGESVGPVATDLLMGDINPHVGNYSYSNPLTHVGVIQAIYPALIPRDIVDRVRNCNRPGGPVEITEEDAEEILIDWKEAMEDSWTEGWDDENDGNVQFVGYFDDVAVIGTLGRFLQDITLENGTLTAISIVIIAVFSSLFLFDLDLVESRVLITLAGVALVVLAFFAALGFAILVGIKININIAWTLPFIILGLGVDDVYIVLLSLKKQRAYSEEHFIQAMKEVVVPVTMTSLVNAAMFAIMNIVDVPAVYKTAQVALIAVIFLYIAVIFTYPAYCYLDMKRQKQGRLDIIPCKKRPESEATSAQLHSKPDHGLNIVLYEKIYRPLVLGDSKLVYVVHFLIWCIALAMLGVSIWGITERQVGLGLEEFFPDDHQAGRWATVRTETLASWSIGMNFGALNYTDPMTQMGMIKQFEGVVGTRHVAESDTKNLWMADFAVWTTRQCTANFDRKDASVYECGMDQVYTDNSTCSGTWYPNTLGLRQKQFLDPDDPTKCFPYEAGVCRPASQMHPLDLAELNIDPANPGDGVFCPVFEGWTDEKLGFCIRLWRKYTGGGGGFVFVDDTATETECSGEYEKDEELVIPIPFSRGPTMFGYDLNSHDETLDLIRETRAECDDVKELHCWMSGIPYDYWEQYLWVEDVLLQAGGAALGVGFAVSFFFLAGKLMHEGIHPKKKILLGSFFGALFIFMTCALSMVSVVGLSFLADVNLTAFSNMSFVLSVGFSVEYSVHVVHRFFKAPNWTGCSKERVKYAMSFLALPTFMAFISSTIGVACLAFTDFEFNSVYFFRPLIIMMFVTYFYGAWFLPTMLTMLDWDILKLGKIEDAGSTAAFYSDKAVPVESSKLEEDSEEAGKEPDDEEEAVVEEAPEEATAASKTDQVDVDEFEC